MADNFIWKSEPYLVADPLKIDNPDVPPIPQKKRRRGSRGGRNKKKGTTKTSELTFPRPIKQNVTTTTENSPTTYAGTTRHTTQSLLKRWCALSGKNRRYTIAISITLLTSIISYRARGFDSHLPFEIGTLEWRWEKQIFFIFWSASVVPFLSIFLNKGGHKHFYSDELKDSPAFPYFQTTENLLTILGSVLTFVFNYVIVALFAWTNIKDPPLETLPDHWFWVDRQTIAFIVTLMVSILAAMLTNASKDLSTVNEQTRNDFRNMSNSARHTLSLIQQETEFLWDEFEETFKSSGKWFLYTANSYLKTPNNTSAIEILEYIDATLTDTTTKDEVDSFISARLSDLGPDQNHGLDWSNPQWAQFFNQRDFREVLPLGNLDLDKLLDPIRVSLEPADRLAIDIANRISISSSDGRFCLVASLDEKSKSFGLISQRRANALCQKIPVNGADKWVYGYFPTDSSLTLEIVSRMIADSSTETAEPLSLNYQAKFIEVYALLQSFSLKNKARIKQLNDSISNLENLLSTYALPMSLLTDDSRLLASLLDTGTDNHFDGKSFDDQQERTLARFLTYSAAYYVGQVWNQDSDRKLPINFPSPFVSVRRIGDSHRRHSARRFEELRKSLEYELCYSSRETINDNTLEARGNWAITLEILNSQSPTMNWIRAGHAFVTREAFLSADIENPLTDGIEDNPIELAVRQKLIGVLFRSDAMEDSVENYLERQRVVSLSQRIDGTPEVLVDITRRAENVVRRMWGENYFLTTELPTIFGGATEQDHLVKQTATRIVGPISLRIGSKSQITTILPYRKSVRKTREGNINA